MLVLSAKLQKLTDNEELNYDHPILKGLGYWNINAVLRRSHGLRSNKRLMYFRAHLLLRRLIREYGKNFDIDTSGIEKHDLMLTSCYEFSILPDDVQRGVSLALQGSELTWCNFSEYAGKLIRILMKTNPAQYDQIKKMSGK